jgi:hypothetical protein
MTESTRLWQLLDLVCELASELFDSYQAIRAYAASRLTSGGPA